MIYHQLINSFSISLLSTAKVSFGTFHVIKLSEYSDAHFTNMLAHNLNEISESLGYLGTNGGADRKQDGVHGSAR